MIARYLAVGLLAWAASLGLQAQPTLAELVTEAKADWMFGSWEAQSDSGESVRLNISWDLDQRVIVLHVKTGEIESKGFTALDPTSHEPTYVSFDSRGSLGKGTWGLESEALVLRIESRSHEYSPRKLGFVFTGNATDGLQVRLHPMTTSGDLESPARLTLKFKKQK